MFHICEGNNSCGVYNETIKTLLSTYCYSIMFILFYYVTWLIVRTSTQKIITNLLHRYNRKRSIRIIMYMNRVCRTFIHVISITQTRARVSRGRYLTHVHYRLKMLLAITYYTDDGTYNAVLLL